FGAFEVSQAWDSGAVNPICGYRRFLEAVRDETGIIYHSGLSGAVARQVSFPQMECGPAEVISLTQGSRIDNNPIALGQNASMTFLYVDGSSHGTSYNKNSLVVRLDLGQVRVLLMGDAEAGARLAPSNPPSAGSIEDALLQCCASELR